MDYEYVALTWTTDCPCADNGFALTYQRWVEEGWTEVRRAPYPAASYGGACIMRRPKDEPYKYEDSTVTEEADPQFGPSTSGARPEDEPERKREPEPIYEYVAVLDKDEAKGQWDALKKRGWVQTRCVRLSGRLGHIHLMCRVDPTVVTAEVESKDKPHKWTEAEIREIEDAHIPRMWTETELRELAQHIAGTLTLWQLHASQWTETQLVDTILGAIQEILALIVPASESIICSESRLWTEAEIQEIARKVLTTAFANPGII